MRLKDCKVGLYEKALPGRLTWRQKIREAKKSGYDFIELSVDETDERLVRVEAGSVEGKQILEAVHQEKFPLLTMCLSGNRRFPIGSEDGSIRCRGIRLIRDAVDFAVAAGIRVVQLAGYDEYYRPRGRNTEERFYEALMEVAGYAACRAVTLAVENVDTDFMDTVSKIKKYTDKVGSPWLKIYADIANLTATGVTRQELYDDIENAYDSIIAWHVKDGRLNVIRDTPYGEGIVDFKLFFEYLAKKRYTGLFVMEMWSDQTEESIAYTKTARDFLERQVGEASARQGLAAR
ncbi:MAG: L-ribulose-5-phosphate 3-epimerase [Christensenella sp.]|nr:L-ribulose-5-phosphate 3-epimerase [Christensenella sp.]